MPDVLFGYDEGLVTEGRFHFELRPSKVRQRIRPIVAKQMDCLNDDGQHIVHLPEQIKFVTFGPLPDRDSKLIVMHVMAYDWPDRMRNIDERLKVIGFFVQQLLKLPQGAVDASFIPLPRETATQRSCWINV